MMCLLVETALKWEFYIFLAMSDDFHRFQILIRAENVVTKDCDLTDIGFVFVNLMSLNIASVFTV